MLAHAGDYLLARETQMANVTGTTVTRRCQLSEGLFRCPTRQRDCGYDGQAQIK